MSNMFGISTIKEGYYVRLHFQNGKPKYYKLFKDLDDAIRWRDNKLRRLKTMGMLTRPHGRKCPQNNNKLGILGVYYAPADSKCRDSYKVFYVNNDGGYKSHSFSISKYGKNKYGEEIALLLAIESRRQKKRATPNNKDDKYRRV